MYPTLGNTMHFGQTDVTHISKMLAYFNPVSWGCWRRRSDTAQPGGIMTRQACWRIWPVGRLSPFWTIRGRVRWYSWRLGHSLQCTKMFLCHSIVELKSLLTIGWLERHSLFKWIFTKVDSSILPCKKWLNYEVKNGAIIGCMNDNNEDRHYQLQQTTL